VNEKTKKKAKVTVRRWRLEDIPALEACHRAIYQDYPQHELFSHRVYQFQLQAFPEGQFLAESEGKVVGYASSIIVQLDDDNDPYSYSEITGAGTFKTHNPGGDTLYGADIGVHPDYRGRGIAGLLYEQRKKLMKRHNLRRMVAYGRIPGYREHAGLMTPEEYVQAVTEKKLSDSALNAHLKAGYQCKRVLIDFVRDYSSMNFATWLEMPNSDYNPAKRRIAAPPLKRPARKARVCAVQYLMRRIKTWEEFEDAVEFFVDSADSYNCHFLVFPELFTAQLFSTFPSGLNDRDAILQLAGLRDRYVELMLAEAQTHNLYLIGGSHPTLRDGELFNTAYLFTPTGNIYTQDKLHVTPMEREAWGFRPGKELKVFETPFGRISILICYDIEFPEVVRLLALAGAEIFFVPFSTDEKKAYYRVRYSAQARAVENYVYVVIAGNVGNLPDVKSYLLNYGQSAIFTPSDFAFPQLATAAEADPNTETVVIAEMDLTSLGVHREVGSVRPLYDRRPDLYDLTARIPIQLVRVE